MRLAVKVKPNAKANKIIRWLDAKTIEIAIHAPPKDGKANQELLNFLAELLNVPRSSIQLISGFMARLKFIELPEAVDLNKLKADQLRLW